MIKVTKQKKGYYIEAEPENDYDPYDIFAVSESELLQLKWILNKMFEKKKSKKK